MRTWWKVIYWLLTGCLIGMGAISIFSIGAPLLLLGIVLALYGLKRMGPKGFWLTLVGMGAIPTLFILYLQFSTDRPGPANPNAYLYAILLFAAITLAGILLGIAERSRANLASKTKSQWR
jgi:hypothetical protein